MHIHSHSLIATIILFLFCSFTTAEYQEGIDTTEMGYGLDGAFRIADDKISAGNKVLVFHTGYDPNDPYYWGWYLYNYRFDDIKTVSTDIPEKKWVEIFYCSPVGKSFIVHVSNCYSKVEIHRKLPSGEFVYQYGQSDEQSKMLLAPANYDRDKLYKPNNVIFEVTDPVKRVKPFVLSIEWDPPLENNYELVGYDVYKVIQDQVDTTQQVDFREWIHVGFTPVNKIYNYEELYRYDVYWNIVSIYKNNDDTLYSEPLKGWTMLPDWPSKARNQIVHNSRAEVTIKNDQVLLNNFSGNSPLTLYDLLGRTVFSFNPKKGDTAIRLNQKVPAGMYVLRLGNTIETVYLK